MTCEQGKSWPLFLSLSLSLSFDLSVFLTHGLTGRQAGPPPHNKLQPLIHSAGQEALADPFVSVTLGRERSRIRGGWPCWHSDTGRVVFVCVDMCVFSCVDVWVCVCLFVGVCVCRHVCSELWVYMLCTVCDPLVNTGILATELDK